ncbi:hypothetical protein Nepgr_006953 [Nepenthes gracilis]|uniref:Uncharacterized protein n=1 Tax=Nepenthes gracilis TaxID=150966 RepID=A0AAD3XHU6_NEPGR|nr:hypothetical protein Nepgr_006953 [Nepenthes gracilis]
MAIGVLMMLSFTFLLEIIMMLDINNLTQFLCKRTPTQRPPDSPRQSIRFQMISQKIAMKLLDQVILQNMVLGLHLTILLLPFKFQYGDPKGSRWHLSTFKNFAANKCIVVALKKLHPKRTHIVRVYQFTH